MSESAPTASRPFVAGHLAHVEGLRALAAYVVYINHAYAQTWNPVWHQFPPWYLSFVTYAMVAGHLSVTVFIVISGFCLMLPVVAADNRLRGGVQGFLKRRARRILPPYYAALALSLILIWTIIGKQTGTLWDVPIDANRTAITSHLILMQDVFGTGKINYVFWSIAAEWHIYFLFPLLVYGWRRFGPGPTIACALALGYALRIGLGDTRLARANPQYIGMFTLGMFAAYLAQGREEHSRRLRAGVPWLAIAAACVMLVAGLTWAWTWQVACDRFYVIDLPIGIAASSVLVHLACGERNPLRAALSWKPLVFIGTFSYSIYLIHAPLLQVLWQYGLHPLHVSPVPMFLFYMGPGALLIVGASYGFFRLFEAPFLKRPSSATPQADGSQKPRGLDTGPATAPAAASSAEAAPVSGASAG